MRYSQNNTQGKVHTAANAHIKKKKYIKSITQTFTLRNEKRKIKSTHTTIKEENKKDWRKIRGKQKKTLEGKISPNNSFIEKSQQT